MKNNVRGLKYNILFKVVTKDARGVPLEEAEWNSDNPNFDDLKLVNFVEENTKYSHTFASHT